MPAGSNANRANVDSGRSSGGSKGGNSGSNLSSRTPPSQKGKGGRSHCGAPPSERNADFRAKSREMK